jgi:hypothetical protein
MFGEVSGLCFSSALVTALRAIVFVVAGPLLSCFVLAEFAGSLIAAYPVPPSVTIRAITDIISAGLGRVGRGLILRLPRADRFETKTYRRRPQQRKGR